MFDKKLYWERRAKKLRGQGDMPKSEPEYEKGKEPTHLVNIKGKLTRVNRFLYRSIAPRSRQPRHKDPQPLYPPHLSNNDRMHIRFNRRQRQKAAA